MFLPQDTKKLIDEAKRIVEVCSASLGNRGAAYREYSQFIETGRTAGGLSLANMLFGHIDRLSSYLFCPTDARFNVTFEHAKPKNVQDQAEIAGAYLTNSFQLNNIDLSYGLGVGQALSFGASHVKFTGKTEVLNISGQRMTHLKDVGAMLVPPWLMGVENEGKTELDDQECFYQTVFLNRSDIWRRIQHFDDADKLLKRALSHSTKGEGPNLPSSFIQILSTSQLNISPQGSNPPSPGGIIQIAGDPNYSTVGPQVLTDQIPMQEIWAWDDEAEDYLMIQYIEPDILIAPRFRRVNEFCPGHHPFVKIQPNMVPGYYWGRSEITDLIALQSALSETMDDFRRVMGVQYDGRYGFVGLEGDPQEAYDDMRMNGWVNMRQGGSVNNLTPNLPAAALEYIKLILSLMEQAGGFDNILSGRGEAGVRAGNHANTLMKTASPRLRDRSLIVERQFAEAGDRMLSYVQAKDATEFCTNIEKPMETSFLLAQLPDDRRVVVDSHSTSPIYENDHNQLAAFGLKAGLIDGEDAIEMLNFPKKDEKKRKFKEREFKKAQFEQQHPEIIAKLAGKAKK